MEPELHRKTYKETLKSGQSLNAYIKISWLKKFYKTIRFLKSFIYSPYLLFFFELVLLSLHR
ncbi:MAG TPA: hypothetical protein EYG69_00325 [Campylobacterales bacterium]|nr:hypothetical protein [Campylobacterales bacterium]